MLELLIVRHGRTDWNNERMIMGQRPIPLNEQGKMQAERIALVLQPSLLSAVLSSPVVRAKETADIIASKHEGLSTEIDDGLAEIDYGDWIGRTFDDIEACDTGLWMAYKTNPSDVSLPGGESILEVKERVSKSIDSILKRFNDGKVVLVTHADIFKLTLLHLLNLELETLMKFTIDNCALSIVRVYPEVGPRLVAYTPTSPFESDF